MYLCVCVRVNDDATFATIVQKAPVAHGGKSLMPEGQKRVAVCVCIGVFFCV